MTKQGLDIEKTLEIVDAAADLDIDPHSGKLFAYVYETGDKGLRKVTQESLLRFSEKNMLDFTVFRSAMMFEREIVKFGKELMHGDDNVVGTVTSGGTESIFLAVKAARDHHRKVLGKTTVPEIVVPVTIHPAFYKAADYMGLDVKRFPIDERRKADLASLNEAITDRTALIALSAPNWPFGTIDPIKEAGEIAKGKGVLLHVDACLGGFILPFFERIGEKVPLFDFRVDGVTSISLDVHKYGYAPKGSSIVLFANSELKKNSMYVDLSSPGYVFVNQAVLSSRSMGPLAAAYAAIRYLGKEGYEKMSRKVLVARNKIFHGLRETGFDSVAPIESSVLSLYSNKLDILNFAINMGRKGWCISLQRGLKEFGIPINIHLTISPIHEKIAENFIKDAKEAASITSGFNMKNIFESIQKGEIDKVMEDINTGKLDSIVVPLLLEALPQGVATDLVKEVVIQWFK